ncbi:MAG: hypothetical protein QXQ37_06280 [Nitrososphaerota archaeon]
MSLIDKILASEEIEDIVDKQETDLKDVVKEARRVAERLAYWAKLIQETSDKLEKTKSKPEDIL